jgi:hypothetical protein
VRLKKSAHKSKRWHQNFRAIFQLMPKNRVLVLEVFRQLNVKRLQVLICTHTAPR